MYDRRRRVDPFVVMSPPPTAGPSRRPLPTPRTRPESMPPSVPLVVQAPAPSRPAILASLASPRRPLPTPLPRPTTKHTSVDLSVRPNSFNTPDLRIPSSLSRRTAPLPDIIQRPLPPPAAPFATPPPTWPRSSRSESHQTQESRPDPLWNRNPPPIGPNVIERRSTVSGVVPPVIFQPRPDARRAVSPERAQPVQFSPPRRPLPSSPTEPPRVPSLHQRIPTSPEDERDPSSPSDVSSLSDCDAYEPMTFADPTQLDGDTMFVRATNAPSPQFGIRDLPAQSRIAIANRNDKAIIPDTLQEQTAWFCPARSATLPQPPASNATSPQNQLQSTSIPQSPRTRMSPPASTPFSPFVDPSTPLGAHTAEPQSLTLRFASMDLAEERQRDQQTHHQASSPSPAQRPIRTALGPTSPIRQQQTWPTNVPPLPRTPGNTTRPFFGTTDVQVHSQPSRPNGTSSPPPAPLPTSPTLPARPFSSSPNFNAAFDRKSFAQQSPRPPSHLQSQHVSQPSPRQLQKQRARDANIDLDDAPPPSLRRSPSPVRQGFTQPPAIEIMNDTPPRRQWTPAHDATSRTANGGRGTTHSYAGFHARSQSPGRGGEPLSQPPAQSPIHPQRSAAPKSSLPDGRHNDTHGALGPSIVVSEPASNTSISVSAPRTPAISISEVPSITVLEHGTPAFSVSAADSPSVSFSPPKISVSDSVQPQRSRPSPGSFGSRHTQIQECSPLPTSGRGPASKRGLPPPPSPSNAMRTNGLSCGGCNGPIIGRIVSAMGQRWHPQCFRCAICNELLEHVSSYERDGKPYCHLDYHETFAPRCFHCKTAIIDERFITLDDPALGKRTYHEQHFFCAECGDPFLAPSSPLPPSTARTGELNLAGDGEFVDDDVGFTVYKGHPYCEACHVRLRMPKCKACKRSIRDGVRAVEALGGKWCWGCFVCEGCKKPFEDPSFFLRNERPFCEPCFSLILRNDV